MTSTYIDGTDIWFTCAQTRVTVGPAVDYIAVYLYDENYEGKTVSSTDSKYSGANWEAFDRNLTSEVNANHYILDYSTGFGWGGDTHITIY